MRSVMDVFFRNAKSKLLMPGPQQSVRGEFPMVPRAGVAKLEGSKARWPGERGFRVLNGATKSGCPGNRKSKLFSSSVSAEEKMRIGNPLWNVRIPESC